MIELGNLRLTDGTRAYISIINGLIAAITELPQTKDWTDCNGYTVAPAGIDEHVHFRDEEEAHKEDWDTGTLAARRGGYTLVADMPNKKRPIIAYERLLQILEYIGRRRIDYRLWFGATSDNLGEIAQAVLHPRVLGVKVYRGSSTGSLLVEEDKPFWKIGELVAGLQGKKKIWLATHNEDEELMRQHLAKLGRKPKISDHCQIRDTEAEFSSVQKTIQMQRDTGCPVLYLHISTPESLHALYDAKQEGLPVLVEVCTHHTCLSDRGDDPFGKVNPPLRTQEQMARVNELIMRNDVVDTIASDHAPHGEAEKLSGDYDKTPSGLTGVQTTIPLLLDKISKGQLAWERFVDLTSRNPAKAFGLNRGRIEPDAEAELILVDPNKQWTISNRHILSKCGWTPYHGTKVQGAVKAVFTQENLQWF